MKQLMSLPVVLVCYLLLPLPHAPLRGAAAPDAGNAPVDFQQARGFFEKRQRGEQLTVEEQAYVARAIAAQKAAKEQQSGKAEVAKTTSTTPVSDPKIVAALVPLDELTGTYKGESGGLYPGGRNTPPPVHGAAYLDESNKIQTLDAAGKPAKDGKIVLLSIGMSNTTMEYSHFKKVADADPEKSTDVVIVDGAKGARTGIAWSLDGLEFLPAGEEQRLLGEMAKVGMNIRKGFGDTWTGAEAKLQAGNVTARQVQVLWIKQAEAKPGTLGEFPAHAKILQASLVNILNIARQHYPNLRVAYLSSRIFGGYATTPLNPEPYAYEEAFSQRWLIEDQINGEPRLNYNPARGTVKSPIVVWGPYLWANGTTPRKSDGFVWNFEDFVASDRTHPDTSARQKVADLLLHFLKTDPGARRWFVKTEAAAGR
ncbi:MAG: hypothetical protein RL077_1687 [Verrucomicrobiota bacterium]|jgi:hypothetical protein